MLLLLLGYGIPSIVMIFEDKERKLELKSFVLEDISLDSQNVDILEIMEVFPDMILNPILVESQETMIEIKTENVQDETENMVSEGRNETHENNGTAQEQIQENHETVGQTQESNKNANAKRIENSITEFLEIFPSEHSIEFVELKAKYFVLMVSEEDKRIYPFWECYGMDTEKREYYFWLSSDKVVAFQIPYDIIGVSDEKFVEVIEGLGEYYNVEIIGLAESISQVYKEDYWQNALMLFRKEEEKDPLYLNMFKIKEDFLFNIYPGNVSSYDGEYDASVSFYEGAY